MAANGLTPLLHPFESFMPSVGWQPSPALLTQVSPSAQAVIKTVTQHGRLWSSTIAASLRHLPLRTNAQRQISNLDNYVLLSLLTPHRDA